MEQMTYKQQSDALDERINRIRERGDLTRTEKRRMIADLESDYFRENPIRGKMRDRSR